MQDHRELPPPLDAKPVSGFRFWAWFATGLIVLALLLAAYIVPLPMFYLYLPGPVRDVEQLVDVGNARVYSSDGELLLTTVSIDTSVTTFNLIGALFDPSKAVVSKEQVTGGGSLDDAQKQLEAQMDQSKHDATTVVLSELGLGKSNGALITETVPDTPADGVLQKGDTILAVDGRAIGSYCDVGREIRKREPGDPVILTIRRGGGPTRDVEIETVPNPQAPSAAFIGVAMKDDFKSDVTVDFKTGRIAGPSAGLMFTLGLYDQLTPDDLTHGRTIAGTGTIACDGSVGPIGGIEQKVAAAEANGAAVFLAPSSEVDQAREVADEIQVVAVGTFDDAVEFLEGL